MRKQKVTRRFYAIRIQDSKTVAQSDDLKRLLKRCSEIADDFKNENQEHYFMIYDSQAYPQERSRIGAYNKNGYQKYGYF